MPLQVLALLALVGCGAVVLDGLGGIDQEFVEPAVSVAHAWQCFAETLSRFRSHAS